MKDWMLFPCDWEKFKDVYSSTLTTLIQHSDRYSSQCSKEKKKRERHADQKQINTCITDDMTAYIENAKESATTKKKHKIAEFSKVKKYKKNIQQSIILLYTTNEYVDTKI